MSFSGTVKEELLKHVSSLTSFIWNTLATVRSSESMNRDAEVPSEMVEMLKRLNVDLIEITYPAWERPLSMVWDDRIFMPPAVREFCRFVSRKESFRQFPQSF